MVSPRLCAQPHAGIRPKYVACRASVGVLALAADSLAPWLYRPPIAKPLWLSMASENKAQWTRYGGL